MLRKQQIIVFIINGFRQGVNLLMLEFCWRCQQILPIWNGLKEDYRTVRILVEKKTSRYLLTEVKFFSILNIPHRGMRNAWIVSDMRVWKNDRTHSFWKQQTVVYALHGRQKIGHDNRASRHACVNSSITGKVELHGRYNPNGNQIPDGRDNSNG